MATNSQVVYRPSPIPPVLKYVVLALILLAILTLALSASQAGTLATKFPASGTQTSPDKNNVRLVITWGSVVKGDVTRCTGNIWREDKQFNVWNLMPIPLWPFDVPLPCSYEALRDQINLADAYLHRETHMKLRGWFAMLRDIMAKRFGPS